LSLLRPVADAFNTAVVQCVQDADPESVHRLRTGSRRLQAMLEVTLREDGPAVNALDKPARAWLRQLKRVRGAAGAVRDLDVQCKLLEKWTKKRVEISDVRNETSRDPGRFEAQVVVLDRWLKDERRHLTHTMRKQIKKRQPRLAERQAALFRSISDSSLIVVRTPRPADAVALEDFVRAVDTMPLLDAANLHDFRKATKKARYVAEAGAEGQTLSSVAKALKQVQDAIGEWHDWQCLAEDARVGLGQPAPELAAALKLEVERHFAAAMKTTQTMRGQLTGEWMANRVHEAPAKRPPVATALGNRGLEAVKRPA
jgi:CHAD domain-containing protein